MMRMSQISPPLGIISKVIQICLNARTLGEGRLVQTWRCQHRHNQTLLTAMSAASSIKSCLPWTMSSRLSPPRSTSVLPTVIVFYVIWTLLASFPCSTQSSSLPHPMMCTGNVRGKLRRQRGTQTRGQMLTSVSAKSQLPGGPPALSRDFSQQSRVMFIFGKWSNLDLEQIGRYLKSPAETRYSRENTKCSSDTLTHIFVCRSGRSVPP